MGFVKSWKTLALCRVLLGLLESELPSFRNVPADLGLRLRNDLESFRPGLILYSFQVASSLDAFTLFLAGTLAMKRIPAWPSSTLPRWSSLASPISSDTESLS